jgi:hypothetical protein
MRYVRDGIKKNPHPEEAANAAVSKDARTLVQGDQSLQ